MNLMHLRYFCKLAETQNYTIASMELYISQPGLSGAISSLEQELGVQLFEKKGRNIKLTKYGKEFYSYVNDSLRVLDNGISVMQDYSGKLSGKVDIGAITTIQSNYLPRVIHDFHKEYHGISFQIYQGQTEGILTGLEEETYDIGFCTYNKLHSNMTAIPILTQKVVIVIHESHPLAGKSAVTLSDLVSYPILTYSLSQQIGQQFKSLLENKKNRIPKCNIHYEFPNELYLAGVLMEKVNENDDAVGIVAEAPYLENFKNIAILPVIDVPEDFRKVYMIFNHEVFHAHAVNLFVQFVQNFHSLIVKNR